LNISHVWNTPGSYLVKAKATDEGGLSSNWSESINVIIANEPNLPPNVPNVLSGPTSGFVGIAYSYSTSGTDPNGDKIRIMISWGDGSQSEIGPVNSSEILNISHVWNTPGSYLVKAKATDEGGLSSNWSPELNMDVFDINEDISSTTQIERKLTMLGNQLGNQYAMATRGEATNNIEISSIDE
jgi:PKD repeat protein